MHVGQTRTTIVSHPAASKQQQEMDDMDDMSKTYGANHELKLITTLP